MERHAAALRSASERATRVRAGDRHPVAAALIEIAHASERGADDLDVLEERAALGIHRPHPVVDRDAERLDRVRLERVIAEPGVVSGGA